VIDVAKRLTIQNPTNMSKHRVQAAKLTSHSDQTGAWQTGLPDRASKTCWFGRMGDQTSDN